MMERTRGSVEIADLFTISLKDMMHSTDFVRNAESRN